MIQMEGRTRLALEPADGIAYLRQKVEEMEQPDTAIINLLAAAERRVDPQRAIQRLTEWTGAHPEDTQSLLLLSTWQIEDERYDEARAVLENLVEKAPKSWIGRNNLAYVLMQEGELSAALEQISQARLHGGDRPELLDTEGQIRMRMDDVVSAEQLFRQAASQTSRPEHRLNLAEALMKLGRGDDARRILEQLQQSRGATAERDRVRALLARLDE